MSPTTKIMLSDQELSLVKDAGWILTKQVIIQKVFEMFAERTGTINSCLQQVNHLGPEIKNTVPKIYKGEQYMQLPYVMMDHPRFFEKDHIFAIRTMFWWANFFSITLHISGKYRDALAEMIRANLSAGENDIYIGVHEDQWHHHFEESNYRHYDKLTPEEKIQFLEKNRFIKLALKFDIDEWNSMPMLLDDGYKKIIRMIN